MAVNFINRKEQIWSDFIPLIPHTRPSPSESLGEIWLNLPSIPLEKWFENVDHGRRTNHKHTHIYTHIAVISHLYKFYPRYEGFKRTKEHVSTFSLNKVSHSKVFSIFLFSDFKESHKGDMKKNVCGLGNSTSLTTGLCSWSKEIASGEEILFFYIKLYWRESVLWKETEVRTVVFLQKTAKQFSMEWCVNIKVAYESPLYL